jgi:ribosomal protein S18 acetylase RimI-like enzyme
VANPYLPQSSSSGASRYRLYSHVGTPTVTSDIGDGGDGGGFKFGLGTLFDEIGQGVTGLASLATPGKDGPGFADVGTGLLSSLAGTVITAGKPITAPIEALPGEQNIEDKIEEFVGGGLGDINEALGGSLDEETLRPYTLDEAIAERGLLPALVETVGNVSIIGAGVTGPIRGGAAAARLAGRTGAAARLRAVHTGLIERPLIRAAQHPYRTAGRAFRERALAPALGSKLAASGVADVDPALAPVDYLASELPDTGIDYQKVQVDMDEHAARAEAYRNLPDNDPEAAGAYQAFADEVAEQYRHVTEDLGVTFEFVDEAEPYPSYKEMVADVRDYKRLKVAKTQDDAHPLLTPEQNDQFRAVHDLYGHAATGRDFTRHGEEAAFLAHSAMFGPDAQRAMASETRGQNAVLIDEGDFGAQKAALLPDGLDDPSGAAARFQKQAPAPIGRTTKFLAGVEEKLRARETWRKAVEENRTADMERSIAARAPAVREAVKVARTHLMDEAKAQGIPLGRKEASAMVGDELHARMTGIKALEEQYLEAGVPEDVFLASGVRQRFIPAALRTEALETQLTAAVDARIVEAGNVRQILESGRKGSEGLDGPAAPDATEPTITKVDRRRLQQAEAKLKKAQSDVQKRKEARQRGAYEKHAAGLEDRLGRIADRTARTAGDIDNALADFEHSRTWTPKAWRAKGAMEASARAVYDETIANLAEHGGEWGGSSFNPHTGKFIQGGQDKGYAVALVQDTALEVPLEEFTPQHIEQVVRAYQDVYQHPNTVIGTWVEDGKVYIDPAEIVPTLDDAIIRGAARRQISTYDVAGDTVVPGILKDRPDIAVPFLNRHTNLSRRTKELRDLVEKTGLTTNDVAMTMDLLMRQAVRAADLGLVKHPDEFFSKYVKKFEHGKKGSTRPGVLQQIVLERSVGTPKERAALWSEMQRTMKDVEKVRRWYHDSHDLVERLFRNQADVTLLDGTKINPADLMYQIVAITSFQAMPRDNWTRAMAVFQKFDDLPRKEMKGLTAALKKVTSGKATLEEAFGITDLPEKFAGVGLYGTPKQYLAELFAGRTIDKWTPEHFAEAKATFGQGSTPDRAKALDFIEENYPDLIERIGEDAAVKEFWSRQHRAKIISFWDNLADPENSMAVTMDQQMERLFGEEMAISQTKAGNDSWIRYSEQIRDMADELSEATGERILPHELQAVMWVFAKDEVGRLQMGHFNALAQDAVDMVREGVEISDEADPVLRWIDEASEPYRAEGQRQVRRHRILRDEVEPAPAAATKARPISHAASPLDYGNGAGKAMRLQVTMPGVGKGGDLNLASAADDVVGFIDYTPNLHKPGEVYIHFITTSPEARGQGIARQMVDELYKITGKDKVDFGDIEAGEIEVLRRKMAEAHPDRGNYGKPGRYEADEADAYFESQPKRRAGKIETEEDVVYQPGWGALARDKKVELFGKRRAQWLLERDQINASIRGGDIDGAVSRMNKYVVNMQTKAPRSLGLADDAAGANFLDIWMKGEFHSAGYKAAANSLDRLDTPPGELPPLMQSFRDKILGEFVPLDDGTRGVIRIFEDGNFATLVHENGHLLRRMLPAGEMRAVERTYGIRNGVWDVAAEERFANDFLNYMSHNKAPKGLGTTFARVREALGEIWQMVQGSFQRKRVPDELAVVYEDWLNPAVRQVDEGIAGLPEVTDPGTVAQRLARPPRLPEPPAKKGDYYAAGRKGQKALARVEKLAVRQRSYAAAAAQAQKQLDDIRAVLNEGRLPTELEAQRLVGEAGRIQEGVNQRLGTPSTQRTPARWQPLWDATKALHKEAETNPALADALSDLPETLQEVQALALSKGFDPVHVRQFTPAQVRRLVFGNMRLGMKRDLLHEEAAGTRKARSGALSKAGGVDHSIESFLAASVEAISEKRTNAVVSWVESNMARRIAKGQPIPEGWQAWDPVRTYLLTGTEVSEGTTKALAAQDTLIVPDAVVKTMDRFTKDYDHWAYEAIRKVTSPWRTLVLTLSPGWYARNIVGNAILASVEGVKLQDWKKAWHSYKQKDEMGRFADVPFVTSDTLAHEAGIYAEDSVVPRRGVREAQREGGRLAGTAKYASRRMLRINEVVDEFARSAVYHRGRRLNMTPDQAWSRAKEALVDYNNLSSFERTAVRSVVPFYAWQKGILKLTTNQIIDHPARIGVVALIGRMQAEYIADRFGVEPEDVPGFYKHLLGDRNVRSWNPFSDPSEILTPEGITRSMNPFMELSVRKGLGAPEFYTDDRRLGFFGTPQQDVNVSGELGQMVTRSPGGRIIGEGPGAGSIGLGAVDEAALRQRFQKARRTIHGLPAEEEAPNPYLPTR